MQLDFPRAGWSLFFLAMSRAKPKKFQAKQALGFQIIALSIVGLKNVLIKPILDCEIYLQFRTPWYLINIDS